MRADDFCKAVEIGIAVLGVLIAVGSAYCGINISNQTIKK